MKVPERTFETVKAEPGTRPLWIGLMGPSGGGKTFSALRLAVGIQSVIGGQIEIIDTESGRGKHYAEMFDYQYTAFPPPHGSLDYQAAIDHAVKVNKSSIIIIDSASHEHEGDGGMIESHERELDRMAGDDWKKRDAVAMLAWTKPKAARKQLLRSMLAHGTSVVFILCFRADESSKPVKKGGKTEVIQMGFMPIAGKGFVYECTVCALLMPGANGVPTWNPENVGEKMMKKLPEQFKEMFAESEGKPMSEEHGVALAKWSLGGSKAAPVAKQAEKPPQTLAERAKAAEGFLMRATSSEALEKRWKNAKPLCDELRDPVAQVDPHLYADLKKVYDECAAKFRPGFVPPEAGGEPPDGAMSIEYAKDLANRVETHLMAENDGSKSKAELALSELTSGKVQTFAALPLYIFDHNEISGKLIAAMEEG